MIELLAAIRPDEQNLPLLLHVLGAMILVGGLADTARARSPSPAAMSGTSGSATGRSSSSRLPGWILMRIGAQWIYSEQGWDDLPDDSTSLHGSESATSSPTLGACSSCWSL